MFFLICNASPRQNILTSATAGTCHITGDRDGTTVDPDWAVHVCAQMCIWLLVPGSFSSFNAMVFFPTLNFSNTLSQHP